MVLIIQNDRMEWLPWRLLFCLVFAKIGHPREGEYRKKHKSLEPQRKRKALLCAFVVPLFQGLLRQNDAGFSGTGFNAFLH